MADFMLDWKRSVRCGEVSEANVGQEVTVMGWVDSRRDLGALVFIYLRDRSGMLQCVFDAGDYAEDFAKVESIRSEFVLAVRGKIAMRSEEAINRKVATGTIELQASSLKILSKSETPPFYIKDDVNTREDLRLKYRYLDLRRPVMQQNLLLRHKLAQITRNYFSDNGFLEIETPMLTKSTPEGARDYLVPSRVQQGKFYALPQSPQLFKQLLMVSGFDRYFQIVKCFRDEDLRADRQPEFTQIDLEMSFVDQDDVMRMNEGLVQKVFREAWGVELEAPFRKMTYREAMERFGSDKPDTRFAMEIQDISNIARECSFKVFHSAVNDGGSVRGINVKNGDKQLARRELDALVDFVKQFGAKGMAWINVRETGLQSPIAKFFSQEELDAILKAMDAEVGDTLMFVSDADDNVVFDALGHLRLHLGQKLGLIDYDKLDIMWVTEFPMFEYDKEEERYVAKHHPFTSPMDEDIALLDTAPDKVRAKAYDLIINGNEVGGGSCRIYNGDLQQKIFNMLGFSDEEAWERFGFLLEAFKFGVPPHAGMAYGFDRLNMILSKTGSIRDVIAFPKIQTGGCPMTGAPDVVEQKQLDELAIAVVAEDENE